MKDKKTKVIDALYQRVWSVLLPGLEEEHEHRGQKNTIMNMIHTPALSSRIRRYGRWDDS